MPAKADPGRAPVIIVHSLGHAVAALAAAAETDREVMIASAPEAGVYAGPGWWRNVVAAARAAVPQARLSSRLDCGAQAGAALAAIRAGVEGIVFTGRADVAARLADIAGQHGVALEAIRPAADLDLAEDFFAADDALRRRCAEALGAATRERAIGNGSVTLAQSEGLGQAAEPALPGVPLARE